MPASSPLLNQPTRSHTEYLHQRMESGQATRAEIREWLDSPKEPFPSYRDPEPVLKGQAAVSTAYLSGLDRFHALMLAKQVA